MLVFNTNRRPVDCECMRNLERRLDTSKGKCNGPFRHRRKASEFLVRTCLRRLSLVRLVNASPAQIADGFAALLCLVAPPGFANLGLAWPGRSTKLLARTKRSGPVQMFQPPAIVPLWHFAQAQCWWRFTDAAGSSFGYTGTARCCQLWRHMLGPIRASCGVVVFRHTSGASHDPRTTCHAARIHRLRMPLPICHGSCGPTHGAVGCKSAGLATTRSIAHRFTLRAIRSVPRAVLP